MHSAPPPIAPEPASTLTILCIEDSEFDATILKQKLEVALSEPFTFIAAASLREGLRHIAKQDFDLILVDMELPDSTGFPTIQSILAEASETPVIVHSSNNDPQLALNAVSIGAQDVLVKGRDDAMMLRRVIMHSIERKAFLKRMKEHELLLQLFTKHTPAAVAMFDAEMRYLLVSDRWLSDYKLDSQNITGQCHYDIFPDAPSHWRSIFAECLAGKSKSSEEDYFLTQEGVVENIRWEIHPWYQDSKHIGGIIMFTEVITEKLAMQQALKEAKEHLEIRVAERTAELEAANKAKSEFFTNITHELRTPLHAIINFSNFGLKKSKEIDRERLLSYFKDINKSGRRLLWLVDDILDLSKAQSGAFILSISEHEIDDIIDEVKAELDPLLQKNKMTLTIERQAPYVTAWCDRDRVIQVLINLVSNAIKFSPPKSTVTVKLWVDKLKPRHQQSPDGLVVSVIDQGSGIPEAELETVFDEFVQSAKVKSGDFSKGTGLGLAICRNIIRAHNGRIWAENNDNHGTCLSFTLPVNQEDAPAEEGEEL